MGRGAHLRERVISWMSSRVDDLPPTEVSSYVSYVMVIGERSQKEQAEREGTARNKDTNPERTSTVWERMSTLGAWARVLSEAWPSDNL